MTEPKEVLTGDVYKRGYGNVWELVLSADGISIVDSWKVPSDWRDEFVQPPWAKARYVPGYGGGIKTDRRFNIL